MQELDEYGNPIVHDYDDGDVVDDDDADNADAEESLELPASSNFGGRGPYVGTGAEDDDDRAYAPAVLALLLPRFAFLVFRPDFICRSYRARMHVSAGR